MSSDVNIVAGSWITIIELESITLTAVAFTDDIEFDARKAAGIRRLLLDIIPVFSV